MAGLLRKINGTGDNVTVKEVIGKESHILSNKCIEIAITKHGGHMAPVTFYRDSIKPVSPYFISPWQLEDYVPEEPVLRQLRGDFFCMPCGLPELYRKEGFTEHGETATGIWDLELESENEGVTELFLSMNTKIRKGNVKKSIRLKEGHNAIYIKHVLNGYSGSFCFGHHATLVMPEEKNSVLVSTSPIKFGFTLPRKKTEYSSEGEYYSLQPGMKFESIRNIPTIWKEMPYIDCSKHPIITGFVDVLQVYNEPSAKPAWVAAYYVREGFVWYALKDPGILPTTVFWMENRGRHLAPWNGRIRCVGLEDNCVAIGDDRYNRELKKVLDENGIIYEHHLNPGKPTVVNYIQGVEKVSEGFGRVEEVEFASGGMIMVSENGKKADIAVDWEFIFKDERNGYNYAC